MPNVKQVRFTGVQKETLSEHQEDSLPAVKTVRKPVDLAALLKEPMLNDGPEMQNTKKPKKRKKKKSEFQKLKSERSKLLKELKKAKTSIKEDSDRKASPEYTPFENRQRLARSTSEIQSKVKLLEEKISTKGKLRREKIQKSFKTKIQTKTIKAGKQHGRLIDLTSKLQHLKLGEEQLRFDIIREKSISSASAPSTSSCHSNTAYEMIPPESEEMAKWVEMSEKTRRKDGEEVVNDIDLSLSSVRSSPELELHRLGSSLSNTSELTLEEKETKAKKLARKYDFTREFRNLMHEHMISRSYSFAYINIIPPYKRIEPKPTKTKQSYNRAIYEDKLNVLEFAKKQKRLPALV